MWPAGWPWTHFNPLGASSWGILTAAERAGSD
jgi:hypothetical protein